MNKKILLVEDEIDVQKLVVANLKAAGFGVISLFDGAGVVDKAREEVPSLILLDLHLPKMPGLEVCRALKNERSTAGIPIIILTAKADEVDRIVGLELGADDYVTKPFSPRELVLRVKSVLRRLDAPPDYEQRLVFQDIVLDRSTHSVSIKGKSQEFTATEFKLLSILLERKGRVLSRDKLLNDVWGYESAIDTRTVDTHVRRLREKLGKHGDCIETVRGFGYRIKGE